MLFKTALKAINRRAAADRAETPMQSGTSAVPASPPLSPQFQWAEAPGWADLPRQNAGNATAAPRRADPVFAHAAAEAQPGVADKAATTQTAFKPGRHTSVTDQDTGSVHYYRLKLFVENLIDELESREAWMVHCMEKDPMRVLLQTGLGKLRSRLHRLTFELPADDPAQSNMEARNCFSDMSKDCKSLLAAFPAHAKAEAAGEEGLEPLAEMARYFTNLQDYTNELKRHHYTRAANFKLTAHARQEIANMEAICPGIARQRAGSEVKTAKAFGFGIRSGLLIPLTTVGPSINYSHMKQMRMMTDEDIDSSIFDTWSDSVSAGIQATTSVTANDNEDLSGTSANFSAHVRASKTKGNYHNHRLILNSFKALLKRQQSGKWYLLGRRSGNENCRSARFRIVWQRTQNWILRNGAGVRYMQTPTVLNVDEEKMMRGTFRETRIGELAERLITRLPDPIGRGKTLNIHELTQRAYPSIDLVLADTTLSSEFADEADELVFNITTAHSPLPTPGNRNPASARNSIQQRTVDAELTASVAISHGRYMARPPIRATAKGEFKAEHTVSSNAFLRLKPAHALMDPAYCYGVDNAYSLLAAMEAKYGDKPKMHTCKNILTQIGTTPEFGDGTTALIASFAKAKTAIEAVKKDYLQLVRMGALARSYGDLKYWKSLPKAKSLEYVGLQKNFIHKIFGIDTDNCSKEEWDFVDNLMNDPEKFMAESYDALSIAFGAVAIKISDFKETALGQGLPAEKEKITLCEQMSDTDISFGSFKNIIDGIFLPIDPERLCREGVLKSESGHISNTTTFMGTAKAAMIFNPTDRIKSGLTKFPQWPNIDHDGYEGVMERLNAANLGVGIGGSRNVRNSDLHPSILRDGTFVMHRVEANGYGFAAIDESGIAHLAKKVVATLKKKRGVNDDMHAQIETDPTLTKENTRWRNRVVNKIGVPLLLDRSAGLESWSCQRQAKPNLEHGFVYRKYNQYCRTISKSNVTAAVHVVSPIAPSPAPVYIAAKGSIAQTVGGVLHETIGDCPAYHILQFRQLNELFKKAMKEQHAAANKANRQSGKSVPADAIDTMCDFGKMRALLLLPNVTDKPFDPETNTDSAYVLQKWFGDPETILSVMQDFMQYQDGRREIGDSAPVVRTYQDGAPPYRSLFDQFDDSADVWEIIKAKNRSNATAAGNFKAMALTSSKKAKDLWNAIPADPRPTLSRVEMQAIESVRTYFSENNTMTAAQRMEFFLADASTPTLDAGKALLPVGRVVFAAYVRIISKYSELNEDAKNAIGYKTYVS